MGKYKRNKPTAYGPRIEVWRSAEGHRESRFPYPTLLNVSAIAAIRPSSWVSSTDEGDCDILLNAGDGHGECGGMLPVIHVAHSYDEMKAAILEAYDQVNSIRRNKRSK